MHVQITTEGLRQKRPYHQVYIKDIKILELVEGWVRLP